MTTAQQALAITNCHQELLNISHNAIVQAAQAGIAYATVFVPISIHTAAMESVAEELRKIGYHVNMGGSGSHEYTGYMDIIWAEPNIPRKGTEQ